MKKINQYTLAVLCLLFSYSAFSQLTTYEKLYGSVSTADSFSDVEPTVDGGYVAVGQTHVSGKSGQFYLVKFDASGNEEFNANFGTVANEQANTVAVLEDRYIVGGVRFNEALGTNDGYLIAVDFTGNLLSETVFGEDGEDGISEVFGLANGQLLVGGFFEKDLPDGVTANLRLYDANLSMIEETFFSDLTNQSISFIEELTPNGDILISPNNSMLIRYNVGTSTTIWELVANSSPTNVQFDNLVDGTRLTEDTYAFVSFSSEDFDTHIVYIDIESGEITNSFKLNIVTSQTPKSIKRLGNNLFVLADEAGRTLYGFDVQEEIVTNSITNTGTSNALVLQTNNKLGIVGFDNSDEATVAKATQLNATDLSEDWLTLVGDFSPIISESGVALDESDDGALILMGTKSIGEESFLNMKKVDNDGVVIWETNFGTPETVESTFAVAATADGGGITAYYNSNPTGGIIVGVQKVDGNGDLEWSQTLDENVSFLPFFGNIVASTDGGYYFGGTVFVSTGGYAAYVAKIAVDGTVEWENEYIVENFTTRGYNLIETSNGDVLVGGYNDGNIRQPILIRLNSLGDELWSNRYETNVAFSRFTGIAEAPDGSFFAAGVGTDAGFSTGIGTLFHVAANGEVITGGTSTNNNIGTTLYDIVVKEDGSIHTAGLFTEQIMPPASASLLRTRSMYVTEYDENFNILEEDFFGKGLAPTFYRMIGHSDGGLAAYGAASRNNSSYGYLIRIDADGVSSTIDIQPQGNLKVFPTVSDGNFSIDFQSQHNGDLSFKIYNLNGQVVHEMTDKKLGDDWQKAVSLSELAAGNYFINIRMGEYAWTQQIIKQ